MNSSQPVTQQPARGQVWLAIATCFLVATIEGYDIQILAIAAPKFAPELGFDSSALGWIFGAVSFGIMIGSSFGGRAGDVFGHRIVLSSALLTFGLFTLLTPFCQSFESFLIVRMLTGIGFGVALPNLMSMAANISTDKSTFRTNAAVFWGVPLGAVVAAGLFSQGMNWQMAFFGGGTAALACIPLVLLSFTGKRPARTEPETMKESFLRQLLSDKYRNQSLLIWVIFALAYLVSYFASVWLPMIVSGKGFTPETAASVMLAYGIFGMIGIFAVGWACDQFGYQIPVTLCWIAIVPVLMFTALSSDWLTLHIIGALTGFLVNGGVFALYSVAAAGYPVHLRGAGSGAALAWARFGAILGPLTGGWLLNTNLSQIYIMGVFAIIALTTASFVFVSGFVLKSRPAASTLPPKPKAHAPGH
ncbi:MFS transporter [Henriciella sp. AS95]|uniref:MFS transporter n=1 Tax=Henriciella sp. AS95 TaxID=3135782 RepID=UPI003170FFE6